jgi:hypothetical protein
MIALAASVVALLAALSGWEMAAVRRDVADRYEEDPGA